MRLSPECSVVGSRRDGYRHFAGSCIIEDERSAGRYDETCLAIDSQYSGIRIICRLVDAVGWERFNDEREEVRRLEIDSVS